jgi:endonuclease/exonuclease/phosphatase family metal-dependent hydrolase
VPPDRTAVRSVTKSGLNTTIFTIMNLISLNTWGGRAGMPLLKSFFEKYKNADVFCLQEIWQTNEASLIEGNDPRLVLNLLEQIAAILSDFNFYFRPQYRGIYGLATFVKKHIPVEDEGELFVFKHQGYENPTAVGNHGRNIQYLTLKTSSGPITIVNFHGLWNGQGKSDSEDRILQSTIIAQFLKGLKNPYVLAGDFNLTPNTQSYRILNEICPKDFVTEFGVTSTRSSFYPKPEKFADYIMTCGRVGASEFEVLPDEISDHLALRADLIF